MNSRKAPAFIALAGVVLAVVLFVVLKDDTADEDTETNAAETAQEAGPQGESGPDAEKPEKPKPKPEPEIASIEVVDGKPVGGAAELEFPSGGKIELEVTSDVADELHFHGYDQYFDLTPGKPTRIEVDATIEGVFELESHSTGELIAEISVVPS